MAQSGGGSVHVWRAFNSGAKSPLVLPDKYVTGELHRGILQNLSAFCQAAFLE